MGGVMRRVILFWGGLLLALLFSISTVHAQSSLQGLQGCSTDPVCGATLRGMAGTASRLPGANQVVPFVRPGAAAANRMFVPNIGDALGLGAGVAGLLYRWGQSQADEFTSYYTVGFSGGQLEGRLYNYTITSEAYQNSFTHTGQAVGPIEGSSFQVTTTSTSCGFRGGVQSPWRHILTDANGTRELGSGSACLAPGDEFPRRIVEQIYSLADGSPDTGPNRDPQLSPSDLPLHLPGLAGEPEIIPWPDPVESGDPDAEPFFPPLILPGSETDPTIVINPSPSDAPEWSELPRAFPNPNAPDYDPSTDPNHPDYQPDPDANPDPTDQPLNAAPAQSSSCSGWGYAQCKLRDKFPFDALGTLPTNLPEPPCPAFTFFGQSAEFCFLKSLMYALKWVVAAAITTRALLEL